MDLRKDLAQRQDGLKEFYSNYFDPVRQRRRILMMIAILHCMSRSFQGIISLVFHQYYRVVIVHCLQTMAGRLQQRAQTVLLTHG